MFKIPQFNKAPKKELRCPYCLETLDWTKLYSNCPTHGLVKAKKGKCPVCNHVVNEVCLFDRTKDPDGEKGGCGLPLPPNYESGRNVVIAVLGSKGVGKSQYLQILGAKVLNRLCREFGLGILMTDDNSIRDTMKRTRDVYDKIVTEETIGLEAGDSQAKFPTVFNMRSESINVNLVVYDTPGESLTDSDRIRGSNIYNYLMKADAILYLVDPLQIKEITSRLNVDSDLLPNDDDKHDNMSVFDRIVTILREDPKNADKIRTKLAFVMTKVDVLRKDDPLESEMDLVFTGDSPLYIPRKPKVYDEQNINDVGNEVKNYFANLNDVDFVTKIDTYFEDYQFFAVSSLGQSADATGFYSRRADPFRVEDPIMWVLDRCGVKLSKR